MQVRVLALAVAFVVAPVAAHDGAVRAPIKNSVKSTFNIVESRVQVNGGELLFTQTLAEAPGKDKPTATGRLAGSLVYSYVWPTSLDSSAVGFEREQGILALAA